MFWFAGLFMSPAFAGDGDFSVRAKAFGSRALLPDDDAQREVGGTPADDLDLDLRLLGTYSTTHWQLIGAHQTTYEGGDSFSFRTAPQSTLDQTPSDDDRRLFDLTWTLDEGNRHRVTDRFDRLAVEYRNGPWRATFGRQAVSWGNGVVFNPLDLFNPFAPTTVDRDYKAGDDLIQLNRLLDGGGDVQLLVVGRRDIEGDVTREAASAGLKWHTAIGAAELEIVLGEHFDDAVYGAGLRLPIGGALLRSDWLYTVLDSGGTDLSWVVNLDTSFTAHDHNVYVFAELFRNGFGVDDEPIDVLDLPDALLQRLERGEVFNLMEHYAAVGATIEWHPLISQSVTWLVNLDDSSNLIQIDVSWEPGDRQRLEAGLTNTFGREGEEYGGVEIGGGLTSGSGTHLYLRWVYHL